VSLSGMALIAVRIVNWHSIGKGRGRTVGMKGRVAPGLSLSCLFLDRFKNAFRIAH
jgi:hypothetical protein